MEKQTEFLKLFSEHIRKILIKLPMNIQNLKEIKFRINNPTIVKYEKKELFITKDGSFTTDKEAAYRTTYKELEELLDYLGNFSLYAYEDELRQGYLSISGGHRVGIAGKVIIENGNIKNFKYISSVNIRISHEVKGAADTVLPFLYNKTSIHHTLIISPPGAGKTTLLRDIIRQVSNGERGQAGLTVGVVDERSEIGGAYLGIPQNDLGIRTDVLDGCPKVEGMMMLIRSMSPDLIAVDEVGNERDVQAIEAAANCGCKILATIHGNSIEDIQKKPAMERLLKMNIFERYIVLDKKPSVGHVLAIYNRENKAVY